MANHYTLFSFMAELPFRSLKFAKDNFETWKKEYGLEVHDDDDFCPDFEMNIQDEGIVFHHQWSGDVESVAEFIHYILRETNCDNQIGFEWCQTCDKPRIGAFGGGCVLITKDDIQFSTTNQVLHEMKGQEHADQNTEKLKNSA